MTTLGAFYIAVAIITFGFFIFISCISLNNELIKEITKKQNKEDDILPIIENLEEKINNLYDNQVDPHFLKKLAALMKQLYKDQDNEFTNELLKWSQKVEKNNENMAR